VTAPNLRASISYVRAHGHDAREDAGRLLVREVYAGEPPEADEWVEIEATRGAVRRWLGY
jgi:hypothetical protein